MKSEISIPEIDTSYIPFGNFFLLLDIIESEKFFPVWISGHTGNGKTKMVEQVCAYAKMSKDVFEETQLKDTEKFIREYKDKDGNAIPYGRKYIRVNFTQETCEDDLLGHKTLVDGTIQFVEGPVTQAIREGAVLLLDELDAGHTNRIMCLQSVLEGKGVHIKAINEFVAPAPGFTVVATSNTKGRGSETGEYVGTSILNAAFLDRFPAMIEHKYPSPEIEATILKRFFQKEISNDTYYKNLSETMDTSAIKSLMADEVQWFSKLSAWANIVRKAAETSPDIQIITTRTLLNVVRAYTVFRDKVKALELACSRYDSSVKISLLDSYSKIDPDVVFSHSESDFVD